MKLIVNNSNDEYFLEIKEIVKNRFDFYLHKENSSKEESFIYAQFFSDHIYIHEFISYIQHKGHAEILFNEMLDFSKQYYTDKSCNFIMGQLAEKDRQDNNWFKSIPFYKKMLTLHSELFSDLCFYNHNDPSQTYTSEYILNNISDFKRIMLYFKFTMNC